MLRQWPSDELIKCTLCVLLAFSLPVFPINQEVVQNIRKTNELVSNVNW